MKKSLIAFGIMSVVALTFSVPQANAQEQPRRINMCKSKAVGSSPAAKAAAKALKRGCAKQAAEAEKRKKRKS